MDKDSNSNDSVADSLSGMMRAAKLFIKVDSEGFLVDSLAISDVVNFDSIESIMTSAKKIISLFTDVTAEEIDITKVFYYKKRARSLRMNPVRMYTTTDGFRAIAEHPSGEIPLGIEWKDKRLTAVHQQTTKIKNDLKRSVSPFTLENEKSVPEKKRKLDAPLKYKTYMPSKESLAEHVNSVIERNTATPTLVDLPERSVIEPPEKWTTFYNEEENSAKEKVSAGNIRPDLKKSYRTYIPSNSADTEDVGKRNQRQSKSEYHWTEDVSCEVILTYDGISERRKLKPAVSAVVQSLVRGKFNVLRSDLYNDLTIRENFQSNQELVNRFNHRDDDEKQITFLNDAKYEIFNVLSKVCMSRARFKDLLDWMKTLQLKEGAQGRYHLTERSSVGGLKVVYDSDEQAAAKLKALNRGNARSKEKNKTLYSVTPLRTDVNTKGEEKKFTVVVPGSSGATSTSSDTVTTTTTKTGEPDSTVYPVIPPGHTLIPVTLVANQSQKHPEGLSKNVERTISPLVSLLPSPRTTATTRCSSSSTQTNIKHQSRQPNILRNKNRPQARTPTSSDPVPMQLYRSYRTEKGQEKPEVHNNVDDKDKDLASNNQNGPANFNNVIIKQEPVDYDEDNPSHMESPIGNSGQLETIHKVKYPNFEIVIKKEPKCDYGT